MIVKAFHLSQKPVARMFLLVTLALWFLNLGCLAEESDAARRAQHPEWAAPIPLAGVPNFHKVSDELYRGAQPTAEGMQALAAFGIKTIINLRRFHSDRDEIGDLNLQYEHIPILIAAVDDDDARRFLRIVTDPERGPIFIHCLHGADRTGAMSAVYRIIVQGWTKDAAIQEMTAGGYGYHRIFLNLIEFLEHLDVAQLRQEIASAQISRKRD